MDVEKTIQFILDIQAKLEASAQGHDERLAKLEAALQEHDARIASVTDLVGRLAQAETRLVERMEGIGQHMEAGFQELRELHADTESKLNTLIVTVDRLVRHNGHRE